MFQRPYIAPNLPEMIRPRLPPKQSRVATREITKEMIVFISISEFAVKQYVKKCNKKPHLKILSTQLRNVSRNALL